MDPFSIITGTAGLIDISTRIIKYLKDIEEAAGTVDEEISSLSQEIDSLVSINASIEKLWLATREIVPSVSSRMQLMLRIPGRSWVVFCKTVVLR